MLSRLNHTVLILCLTQHVVSRFQLLTWKYVEAVSTTVTVTVDKHWPEQSESIYFLRKMLYCSSFLTESHFILTLHFVTCVCVCMHNAHGMHVHVCVRLCARVCTNQRTISCCSSGELYLLSFFLSQVFSLAWKLARLANQQAAGFACLCLARTVIISI